MIPRSLAPKRLACKSLACRTLFMVGGLTVASVSSASASNDASKRVAVVIGNADYGNQALDLNSPLRDVQAVAKAVRAAGFSEVIVQTDIDRATMIETLHRARDALGTGGTLFFYYSGHAISVRGGNWLIPAGAKLKEIDDVPLAGVSVEQVLGIFRNADLRIVSLDACRTSPFSLGSKALGNGGLSRDALRGLEGTIISYAAAPGSVAYDGEEGALSPYTRALVTHLAVEGTDLPNLFMNVRGELAQLTRNSPRGPQRSEEVSSLSQRHRFFFVPAVKVGKNKGDVSPNTAEGTQDGRQAEEERLAATTIGASRERLLLLDFQARGVDKDLASTATNVLGVHLGVAQELEVVTSTELRQMIDIEATRVAMGCTEAECMVELAGAVGARYIITGDVAQLGALYVVTSSVVDTQSSRVLARHTIQVRQIEELPAELGSTAQHLMFALGFDLGFSEAQEVALAPDAMVEEPAPVEDLARSQEGELVHESGRSEGAGTSLPWMSIGGGAGLALAATVVVVSAVATIAGSIPYFQYLSAVQDASSATDSAAYQQARVAGQASVTAYNDWGRWAILGGAVGITLGAAVVVVGAAVLTTGLLVE